MFPRRRVPLALSIWLFGMAAGFARETPPAVAERSAWATLADGAPVQWGCILIAVILTATLLIQLCFALMKNRLDPPALVEALQRSTLAGNYQEAWEVCQRWRQTVLARILQPALERIGQGFDPVETRLAEETAREHRHFSLLLWLLLAGAGLVVVLCAFAILAEMGRLSGAAMSPEGGRMRTMAAGEAAMLAAFGFSFTLPILAAALWLRARAAALLLAASAQARQLVADLPYEEIEGVRIGKDFNAGTILGETEVAPVSYLQVSRELTTLCPSCNGPINSSRNSCPQCGQLLAWS